jgi:hypothetical protein
LINHRRRTVGFSAQDREQTVMSLSGLFYWLSQQPVGFLFFLGSVAVMLVFAVVSIHPR